jgi:electron transfer flavoprotein-quinone oxidoreductase
VGAAAGLALNQAVTVRGMDMALISGALAARAILQAREARDFSAAGLASYRQALEASAIYRDIATFRHVPEVLSNPRLFEEYPQVACGLLEAIMATGTEPKEKMSTTVLRTVRKVVRPRYLADLWKLRKI